MTLAIAGIHHLKFPVTDLDRSESFYRDVFGAARLSKYDHRKGDGTLVAIILEVPGLGTYLELRLDALTASTMKGFDPVTLTVATRADLVEWDELLSRLGVPKSKVLVGLIGWLLAFDDPDGRRLRLYTREAHGPELQPDWNDPWVRTSPAES